MAKLIQGYTRITEEGFHKLMKWNRGAGSPGTVRNGRYLVVSWCGAYDYTGYKGQTYGPRIFQYHSLGEAQASLDKMGDGFMGCLSKFCSRNHEIRIIDVINPRHISYLKNRGWW